MRLGASGVVRLDNPGLFQRFVLEQPWPAVGLLVVAGAVAFVLLNGRGRAKMGLGVAGICLLMAGGVYAVSAMVETTGEVLSVRTRALVAAAFGSDAVAFGRMLEERASLEVLEGNRREGREAIVRFAIEATAKYAIREWNVSDLRVVEDSATVGRCQLHMVVEPEQTRLPSGSWWMVTWRKGEDGAWRVWSISGQQIDGVGAGSRIGL